MEENLEEARRVLIHEMIHHEHAGHDEGFCAELDRISKFPSEEWAAEQAEANRNAEDTIDLAEDLIMRYVSHHRGKGPSVCEVSMEPLLDYLEHELQMEREFLEKDDLIMGKIRELGEIHGIRWT